METETNNTPVVKIWIQGVNYFAAYLGFWKSFSKVFAMKIHSDGIRSETNNDMQTIYLSMFIDAKSLVKYETQMDESMYLFSIFNSSKFENSIKANAKKTIGCFVIWPNDDNITYSTTETTVNNKDGGMLIGACKNEELREFAPPEIPETPIVKLLISELVHEINKASKAGATSLCLVPYRNGIHIAGISPSNSEVSFEDYGDVDEPFDTPSKEEVINDPGLQMIQNIFSKVDSNLLNSSLQLQSLTVDNTSSHSFIIPIHQAKNFAKLKHCTLDPDVLNVYYKPGGSLILEGNITNIGKHYIFIKNSKKQ